MSPRGRKGSPPEDPQDVKPEPVPAWAFVREFRKNRKTGQIWAIELVNGVLSGARECTKPEELTDGALPVLALTTDGLDAYQATQGQCDAWEPEHTPDGLRRNLVAAGHRLDDVETKIAKKKTELKRLNEQRDEVVAQIRRYVRELETGQTNLLDKVERPPVADAPGFSTFVDASGTGAAEAGEVDAGQEATSGTTEDNGGEDRSDVPRGSGGAGSAAGAG